MMLISLRLTEILIPPEVNVKETVHPKVNPVIISSPHAEGKSGEFHSPCSSQYCNIVSLGSQDCFVCHTL